MLTKADLNQIGNVVDERLEGKLIPIKKDVGGLKENVDELSKDMKYLRKKVNKIDKTLDLVVKKYDEGDVKLERRIRKVEDHLGLTSS